MSVELATGAEKGEGVAPRTYAGFALFMLALVLSLAFVFGHEPGGQARFVPDKWLNKDGTFYYLTLRTLVDHGTLTQDLTQPHSWYEANLPWNRNLNADWSDVAVGRGGHWYPKHPILMPLVTVPFFYAFGAYGALILNILCLALLPVLAYRIAQRMAPWGAAVAAAAVFASSAYLTEQGWGYSNDLFNAVLVLLAFERALHNKPIASGVWMSLAIFAKSTNAILLPALALVFLMRKDARSLVRCGIAMVPGCLVYAGLNTWMYGAPWHTGYNLILVRENGHEAIHDVARNFDWGHWWTWVKARLVAPQGSNTFNMWDRAAWWFLAAPGAVVALVRAPKVAVPLLVAVVAPLLLLAPFEYFRVEFLNGSVGLSVAFIAALLTAPWVKDQPLPAPRPGKLRWDRLGPVAAIVILGGAAGVRAAVPHHGEYFEKHLTDAHVMLGPVPCDYFNWQGQRWECSMFDRGNDQVMTGRTVGALPRFGNVPQRAISIAPPLVQPNVARTITYPGVPLGQSLEIHYGFRDGSSARGHEKFAVSVDGQDQELPLGAPGEWKVATVDTHAKAGQKAEVRFEIASDVPGDTPVYFDGAPR